MIEGRKPKVRDGSPELPRPAQTDAGGYGKRGRDGDADEIIGIFVTGVSTFSGGKRVIGI
jgi:hypothetical protein